MNFEKLDEFMLAMPERGIPYCELAVTKDGKSVYHRIVGHSDPEGRIPAAATDIHWAFSSSKVILSLAVMRLVGEGKLGLDDCLSKYIPEFACPKVKQSDGSLAPVKAPITIKHLLTMSSGMTYDTKTPEILKAAKNDPSTLGIIRAIAKEPLRFEPGTRYRYSLSHDVLAGVIEVVSGMKYSEYLQKYFFDPLGIKDIGFRPTEEQRARFTAMYTYKDGTATPTAIPVFNDLILSPEYDSGGAGLFATVQDYIKIITVVANGGITDDGYVLLNPDVIPLMTENHLTPEGLNDFVNARLYGYGWGLCGRVHMNPTLSLSRSSVGEFGWDGAASTFAMIDTKDRVAAYFGTQMYGCGYAIFALHPTMRNIIYECLEK